ncbi:hypothetical protein C900_02319 [Fulvivirga imtechensis AK7]|uniref:Fibronectin type-III domain-containing protein n=1 Tax=Fulvivirga imtechensis AK7 TaxID=1237149 RepID=L8JVW0_9BACT|nr:hypothetical protein [Fulvivirga imtechensis]ELR71734.1 hypothetical protein C900_02319 [Fulvivirga imtechensis AK7]
MRRLQYYITALAFTAALAANGQDDKKPSIKVITAPAAEGVIVRWAPTTPVAWQLANEYGYTVTRYTLSDKDTLGFSEKINLTPGGLYVLPENDWEAIAHEDKWAAIAAQAIYGEDFVLSDPGQGATSLVNAAAEQENRFSFSLLAADISAPTAEAMALRWLDKTAIRGATYVYRVELNKQREGYPVERGSSKVTFTGPRPLPQPSEVEATFGDQSVSISWNTFYLDGIYSSYVVERSDDGGKTFHLPDELQFFSLKKEGSGPLEKMYYMDSIPDNATTYQYRVKGITPFGETGPPSVPVTGQGYVSLGDAIPVIAETVVMQDGTVNITWKFSQALTGQVRHFTVDRGPKAGGPYRLISGEIPPANSTFQDTKPLRVNYYVIKAYGKHGEVRQSFPAMVQLEDSIPPAVPTGLKGMVDNNGIVKITWDANKEADLYGYRVFRSNALKEEYIQVTEEALTTTGFTDSVNLETLTEEVIYTITAQDRRYNQSDYAKPLVLKRPDIVPPDQPVLKSVTPGEGTVFIDWYPASATDIAGYKLFRKRAGSTIWKEFLLPGDSTSFMDELADTGFRYNYSLMAIDDDNLASEATQFSAQPLARPMPAISKISHKVDREKKQIDLTWKYPVAYEEVIVYRSENNGPLRQYARIDSGEKTFTDHQLKVGGIYKYRFKVIDKNGEESPVSDEIEIQY